MGDGVGSLGETEPRHSLLLLDLGGSWAAFAHVHLRGDEDLFWSLGSRFPPNGTEINAAQAGLQPDFSHSPPP